jgi:hypothetical protein
MTFGGPFADTTANFLCVVFSALPTYWFASLVYPANRPEPTPEQSMRFTRKKDVYRAGVLFTYRWLFGTPFTLSFFIVDFLMTYGLGALMGERPVGARQRRSEFGVALPWVAGSALLMQYAPSALSYWVTVADRGLWRVAYIALVDDVVGVLAWPNVKTWKGWMKLVLTQAFTITCVCWLMLSWRRAMILAYAERSLASAMQPGSVDAGVGVEDDGDRFLVE